MVRLYEFTKSKEKEIGEDFYMKPEIEEDAEDKVSIKFFQFSMEGNELKKEEMLTVLVVLMKNEIKIFVNTLYFMELKNLELDLKSIRKIKKILTFKEFKKADTANIG